MATLKASHQGLARIKQARSAKGWATSDFRWIESASGVLGASWSQDGVLAVGISEGTWKRFLAGKYPINAEAFKAYCHVLGVNWEDVVEQNPEEARLDQTEKQLSTALQNSHVIMFNQDRELRYTWIYNNSKEAYGASEDEIIGKRDSELLSTEEAEMLSQIKLGVMETGVETREVIKLKMGEQNCYFDLLVKPLRATNGEIIGVSCTAIDITNRQQSASIPGEPAIQSAPLQVDWGEAPDASVFYGRNAELDTVRQWVVQENCRLVTLLGMGGIGKTSLSVKLAREIVGVDEQGGRRGAGDFQSKIVQLNVHAEVQNPKSKIQYVIWRSLRNAPTVDDLLADLIQFLSEQQETSLPTNLEGRIARLLYYLRTSRCLLILDNAESILQAGDRSGRYRTGYEGYGQLLRCIAEGTHQSCVILTSREKPQGLAKFEGESLPVRSLQLSGLPEVDGRELFNVKGTFTATEADWQTLISRYAGNPLALKIVASSIHDYFGSDISYFLNTTQQGAFLFDDIRDLLEQQFQRLTDLERDIMYWLAIDREPVSLPELQADFVIPIPSREFLESLNSLQRRSLIEKSGTSFTQQPVVMEYVTVQLIERVCEEIAETAEASSSKIVRLSAHAEVQDAPKTYQRRALKSKIFITHALLKASSKDYIRETQANLIVQSVIDQLIMIFGKLFWLFRVPGGDCIIKHF
jgi:PAS domain S-box-containing protein